MRPVLVHVLDLPIYSYSLFVVLAYLGGLSYAWLAARSQGMDPLHVIDVSLWLFVFGIVGARLLFVLVFFPRFARSPLDVFKLWQGGLVFYGGLAGAVAGGLWYLKRHQLSRWQWADLLAPTAMIALAVGRIGCYLNGCCYGKVAPELSWGVVYPPSHPSLGLLQYPVHPTPLYESAASLAIFGILVATAKKKRFQGQIFWTMVLLYAAARFIIEFFRGDHRGTLFGLSLSQGISLGAGVAAIIFMAALYRRRLRGTGPDGGPGEERG